MTTDETTRIKERLRRGEEEARRLGHSVADIADELRLLAAQEVELGVAEAKEQASFAVRGGISGAVAFLTANIVLVFLGLAIMFAIDTQLQTWAAALITAGIYLIIALIGGAIAITFLKKVTFKPRRLINSLQEDIQWAKSQMRSNGR